MKVQPCEFPGLCSPSEVQWRRSGAPRSLHSSSSAAQPARRQSGWNRSACMKDPSAFPRLELSQDFRDYRFGCAVRVYACMCTTWAHLLDPTIGALVNWHPGQFLSITWPSQFSVLPPAALIQLLFVVLFIFLIQPHLVAFMHARHLQPKFWVLLK